ncbi:hypothetical protein Fraau_0928 [Frateuria aurantia DSM 6220]|uniref:SSU ribosomal protein S31P n=2 Tax=Frateuria aurantia TaxID=81475 RepID=H8L1N7_FRAAD|nr:hypothetical protein Fraau_0928 [Frateuria aurantia DSM 6220]
MGKGDRKTRRGKTYRGSYGRTRLHSAPAAVATADTVVKPATLKAAAARKKA